jgi:dipeptidyl-peptidase-4
MLDSQRWSRLARRPAPAAFAAVFLAGLVAAAHGQSRPASQPGSQPGLQPAAQPQTQPTSQLETQPVEPKPLTLDVIYGPDRVDFDGSYAKGMQWLDDGRHYLHRPDMQLMRIDALSGAAEPAYDQDALEAALRAHEDFDDRAAERLARKPTFWADDRSAVLIQHNERLYFYRFVEPKLRKLTDDALSRRVVNLSPHGDAVSFVRENNLYVIDTRSGRHRRITRDGSDTLVNGVLDWVYQEEIYGRGQWCANWWRDDAEYLAYLRLDESKVPRYTIADYIPHVSTTQRTHYPKAGDPNPVVQLGVVRRKTGRTAWIDLSKYDGADILVVRVSWAPDGKLLFSVQDREQRWLELNEADPKTGRMRTLIREVSPAWVESIADPHWLADGSFLWLSDRDGYRHLYHYNRDGELIRRVTGGDWSVRALHGCDAEAGWVYFAGTRDGVFEQHAYRVPLRGGRIERLTELGFSHSVDFDPTHHYFFDTFSNTTTPTKVYLRQADGSLVRVISENEVAALDEYIWTPPELLRIPNRDGYLMNARVIRPPDFDPGRKYPVWCGVYGAPGAQSVHNRWRGCRLMFDQYLAQQGYIVWHCDPYQASGAGAVSAWHGYRRLGQTELADVEDGLRWLIDQGCVDPERIGVSGYSYGGFLASYALTHSKMFRLGVAGALVSDWRNYDSIYTERYMQMPQHNPEGYERAGVSNAAENLHGRLLIVHGLRDDNVHFQNTAQLIDALQQAGKMFDLMIYPRDRHGIHRGEDHFRKLQLKYVLDNL